MSISTFYQRDTFPEADATHDLGSSALLWQVIYAHNVFLPDGDKIQFGNTQATPDAEMYWDNTEGFVYLTNHLAFPKNGVASGVNFGVPSYNIEFEAEGWDIPGASGFDTTAKILNYQPVGSTENVGNIAYYFGDGATETLRFVTTVDGHSFIGDVTGGDAFAYGASVVGSGKGTDITFAGGSTVGGNGDGGDIIITGGLPNGSGTNGQVIIGIGTAGVDYSFTFNGETNDGVFTWMEDEDYFKYSDSILMPHDIPIYFGDSSEVQVGYTTANNTLEILRETTSTSTRQAFFGAIKASPAANTSAVYSTMSYATELRTNVDLTNTVYGGLNGANYFCFNYGTGTVSLGMAARAVIGSVTSGGSMTTGVGYFMEAQMYDGTTMTDLFFLRADNTYTVGSGAVTNSYFAKLGTDFITGNGINIETSGDKYIFISDTSDGISSPDYIQFDTAATPGHNEGQIHWNDTDKTIDVDTNVAGVALQVGQELFLRMTNKTGAQIDNGELVYIDGAQGQRPTGALAKADVAATTGVLAMATHDLANNGTGFFTTMGLVRGIDTSACSDGDEVYLSDSTAGAFTKVAPTAPSFVQKIGYVIYSHATEGIIYVSIDNTDFHETLTFNGIANLGALNNTGIISGDTVIGELYKEGSAKETADSITLNTGTVASGAVADTRQINATYYQVNEVTGSPGFDAEFIFSLDDNPGKLTFVGRYQGNVGHNVVVEAWNYNATTWDSFTGSGSDLPSDTSDYEVQFDYNDLAGAIADYISGTASKIRIYHSSPGNAAHDLYVDYLAIDVQEFVITTGGTYQTITSFTAGENNNVTLNASNGTMTIAEAGKYLVNMSVSFAGTDSATFEGHLFVDDVKVDKIGAKRKLGSGGDVGSTAFTGIIDLSANEVLKVKATSDLDNAYMAIENINWNISKLN